MRAKEFKMLMEFSASNSVAMELLVKHIDEIYFLQCTWKKYWGEVDYLKIYPNFNIDGSKIHSLAEKINHFLNEHVGEFSAIRENKIFHGHIVVDYRFFLKGIEITDLICFDKI